MLILLITYLYGKVDVNDNRMNLINRCFFFIVKVLKLIGVLFCATTLYGQPYIDIATVQGTISPGAGIWKRNDLPATYKQYTLGVIAPIKFQDSSKLLPGVFTERWAVKAPGETDIPKAIQALLIPVTYIKPLSAKWSVAASVIPRWNGDASHMFGSSFQIGGSLLALVKQSNNLAYRFGIYYNKEFFGPLIFPLAGIDWKMNPRNNIFGLLPQILTWEHQVSEKFYWGMVYRLYNNSYRTGYGMFRGFPTYMRLKEMQLLLSADLYLTKRLVFNMQAGHSLFRHYQLGEDVNKKNYYSDKDYNNDFLIKGALLYRVRLR